MALYSASRAIIYPSRYNSCARYSLEVEPEKKANLQSSISSNSASLDWVGLHEWLAKSMKLSEIAAYKNVSLKIDDSYGMLANGIETCIKAVITIELRTFAT